MDIIFNGLRKLILASLFFSLGAFATTYTVKSSSANAYDRPEDAAKVIGKIPKGKKVFASGEDSGFVQVTTKSGRAMWIKMTDLEELGDVSDDLAKENKHSRDNPGDQMHVTWDLGGSAGSYKGVGYSEIGLGVNWFFLDWLAWRNAGFARFVTPKNVYGLDSSLLLSLSPSFMDVVGLTLFGGPGYRFVNEGDSVPFAEGGLVVHLGGLSVGGGMKTLFHSFVHSNQEDDTSYFIILSGGGVF